MNNKINKIKINCQEEPRERMKRTTYEIKCPSGVTTDHTRQILVHYLFHEALNLIDAAVLHKCIQN